jgi:hypothetical protein
MAFLLADVANVLHNILLPYVRDNLPKQTILLDQVKRNSGVTFLNSTFYAPVRTTRHGGVTNLVADSSSTISGTAGLGQASVTTKIVSGAFDISDLAIDATKSSQSAVTNALTFQAESLMTDFSRSINRQFYGDGSGIVAEVAASGGSVGAGTLSVNIPTASCDDGRALDYAGSINGDISPTEYLTPGMLFAVGSPGTAIGTIASVTGTSIVNSGQGTIATNANDAIYLVDGSSLKVTGYEITGIKNALSSTTGTSTYAGLARSTVGWTPNFGSTAEALTLSRMENSYLSSKKYAQSGDQFAIFMNKTLYKKYGDLLTSMRRSVNATDLLGGWTGLEFAAGAGNVGVFLDYQVPDGEFVVMDLDSWTICQTSDLHWIENPSQGSLLRLANKIQYQAEMVWYLELLCLAPSANGHETQKTA